MLLGIICSLRLARVPREGYPAACNVDQRVLVHSSSPGLEFQWPSHLVVAYMISAVTFISQLSFMSWFKVRVCDSSKE
jgi:hypothetical protein